VRRNNLPRVPHGLSTMTMCWRCIIYILYSFSSYACHNRLFLYTFNITMWLDSPTCILYIYNMQKKGRHHWVKSLAATRKETLTKYFDDVYNISGITVFTFSEIDKRLYESSVSSSKAVSDKRPLLGDLLRDLKMASRSVEGLLKYLVENDILTNVEARSGEETQWIFCSKHFEKKSVFAGILEIANSLIPKGYFSHYTALQLHGLTDQIPKIVYTNVEQKMMYDVEEAREKLTQHKIDLAFRGNVRKGKKVIEVMDYNIKVLHGKDTKNTGVIRNESPGVPISVTNLERTLIDACVRPELCGGIHEVVKAYALAAREGISVKRIAKYLADINYVYPYHQAVGFLLEMTGHEESTLRSLKDNFPMEYDFYLLHGKINKNRENLAYSKAWRIFVPKEMLHNTPPRSH